MKKFLALMLALLMTLSVIPISVIAAGVDYDVDSDGCDFYNLVEKDLEPEHQQQLKVKSFSTTIRALIEMFCM